MILIRLITRVVVRSHSTSRKLTMCPALVTIINLSASTNCRTQACIESSKIRHTRTHRDSRPTSHERLSRTSYKIRSRLPAPTPRLIAACASPWEWSFPRRWLAAWRQIKTVVLRTRSRRG